jgi:hypothetical protein
MTPAEWLDQQENICGSLNVTLFAMGKTWEAAVYTICDQGHDDPCIYVLGEMPKRATKLCFRFEGDDRDWFVATYYQDNPVTLEDHQKKYHPFGKTWILHPWNIQEPIDHYEEKKYTRIPASIS